MTARKTGLDKRGTILQVAVELFAKRGLDGVTLRDVAEQSGYQLGSLYHFYPEKTALYDAAVKFAYEACTRLLVDALAGEPSASLSAEDRLRRLIDLFYELHTSDSPHIRLIDREYLGNGSGHAPELIRDVFWQFHRSLNPIVASLAGPEPLSDERIEWYCSYISGLIYGVAKLHAEQTELLGLTTPQRVRQFLDELANFVIQAISPRR